MSDNSADRPAGRGAMTDGTPIGSLPPDAVVLVSGPPMTGKYHLLLRALGTHADRAVFLTTKHGADRVSEDLGDVLGDVHGDRVGIVDCVRHHGAVEETATVKHADSPENLTRIGVKFTELYERFRAESGQVGVGIYSLSNLVMHGEASSVSKFLEVLTGQVRTAGWFTGAVMDDAMTDREAVHAIMEHFDGVIETRENDAGEREYRVRGFEPTASDWTAF